MTERLGATTRRYRLVTLFSVGAALGSIGMATALAGATMLYANFGLAGRVIILMSAFGALVNGVPWYTPRQLPRWLWVSGEGVGALSNGLAVGTGLFLVSGARLQPALYLILVGTGVWWFAGGITLLLAAVSVSLIVRLSGTVPEQRVLTVLERGGRIDAQKQIASGILNTILRRGSGDAIRTI